MDQDVDTIELFQHRCNDTLHRLHAPEISPKDHQSASKLVKVFLLTVPLRSAFGEPGSNHNCCPIAQQTKSAFSPDLDSPSRNHCYEPMTICTFLTFFVI